MNSDGRAPIKKNKINTTKEWTAPSRRRHRWFNKMLGPHRNDTKMRLDKGMFAFKLVGLLLYYKQACWQEYTAGERSGSHRRGSRGGWFCCGSIVRVRSWPFARHGFGWRKLRRTMCPFVLRKLWRRPGSSKDQSPSYMRRVLKGKGREGKERARGEDPKLLS